MRQRVNRSIVSSGEFHAVFDANAVLRDPARPLRMRGYYDSGDHLDSGDAGYSALAQGLDVSARMGKADAALNQMAPGGVQGGEITCLGVAHERFF